MLGIQPVAEIKGPPPKSYALSDILAWMLRPAMGAVGAIIKIDLSARFGPLGENAAGKRDRAIVDIIYALIVIAAILCATHFRAMIFVAVFCIGMRLGLRQRWREVDHEIVRDIMES